MPHNSRNIPHEMFYSVMSTEILRIRESKTKFQEFTKSAKILIGRIIKQGGLINHYQIKCSIKLNVSLSSEKLMIIFSMNYYKFANYNLYIMFSNFNNLL